MKQSRLLLALLSLNAFLVLATTAQKHGHHGPHSGHHVHPHGGDHGPNAGHHGGDHGPNAGHHRHHDDSHVRVDLHHHPIPSHLSRKEHVHSLAHADKKRHKGIISKTATVNDSFSGAMPVTSGAYTRSGTYFARLHVGTPPQRFVLVPDTGSEITWMYCKYDPSCPDCPDVSGRRHVFQAATSSSFKPILFKSEMCMKRLPETVKNPTPDGFCYYDYPYLNANAQGFYANERTTITSVSGRSSKILPLIVGCTSDYHGDSQLGGEGILGLGYSTTTFASHAAAVYGGRFSYCLVDHLSPKNATSYLVFGVNSAITSPQQTTMLLPPHLAPFYLVNVESMTMGGKKLNIPTDLWELGPGMGLIIDSGSTVTTLTENAYWPVLESIEQSLKGLKRHYDEQFDLCYEWPEVEPDVPEFVITFAGGARLAPPVKSYIIDLSAGIKCAGFFVRKPNAYSILGNIMQQEHLWEFDITNRAIRFQPSKCD